MSFHGSCGRVSFLFGRYTDCSQCREWHFVFLKLCFFLGLRGVKGYKRGADTYNLNEDYFREELLSIRLNTDLYRLWKV